MPITSLTSEIRKPSATKNVYQSDLRQKIREGRKKKVRENLKQVRSGKQPLPSKNSQTSINFSIDGALSSCKSVIHLDNVAAPLLSEKEAVEEALREGLKLNGMDFSPVKKPYLKERVFLKTINLTKMLITELCHQCYDLYGLQFNAMDIFREIIVRSSRSAGATEVKHMVKKILKLKRCYTNVTINCNIASAGTKDMNRNHIGENNVAQVDVFQDGGMIHCTIDNKFDCEILRSGKSKLLHMVPNSTLDDEHRDDLNSDENFGADEFKIVKIQVHERLTFSRGKCDSVRWMYIQPLENI